MIIAELRIDLFFSIAIAGSAGELRIFERPEETRVPLAQTLEHRPVLLAEDNMANVLDHWGKS